MKIMSEGDYAITVATAKCLVFKAKASETNKPCLSYELLNAMEALKTNSYSEQGMNEFFDKFGTHAITEADFGSKFVTSAKFKRDKYYKIIFKNAKVIFGSKSDRWGIQRAPSERDSGYGDRF